MPNSLGQAFKDALFFADVTVKYTADEWRQIFDILGSPGRRNDNSFKVTQHAGTPGLGVDVSEGAGIVPSGALDAAGLPANGLYGCRLMSPISNLGPVATPPTTTGQNRIDLVYLQVDDATVIGSGLNEPLIGIQTGVASTAPVKPALPTSSIELASILVRTNVTTILNADITRNMTFSGPAAQAAAIATAIARSPLQGFYWGALTGYGPWNIPSGGWTPASGAPRVIQGIAGHAYLVKSTFSLGNSDTTPTVIRACLGINTTVICENEYILDAGGLQEGTELSRIWYPTVTGSYTVTTKFAANKVNKGNVHNAFSTPFTEITDLGPMT